MPKDNISWLTPRRRRTTGNLKHVPNGQVNTAAANASVSADAPTSPTVDEVAVAVERPNASLRTVSQPTVPIANGEGNLFYAYARKVRVYRWRELDFQQ